VDNFVDKVINIGFCVAIKLVLYRMAQLLGIKGQCFEKQQLFYGDKKADCKFLHFL